MSANVELMNSSTGPNGEQITGSPPSGGAPVTMIGGAEQHDKGHVAWKQEPVWLKYLTLPFAVIAAPFKAGAEAARREPEPGPELPQSAPPAPAPAPSSAGPACGRSRCSPGLYAFLFSTPRRTRRGSRKRNAVLQQPARRLTPLLATAYQQAAKPADGLLVSAALLA